MATVGVTGATGFIGGALVPRLARDGHRLVLVDDRSGPIRVEHAEWPADRGDFASEEPLARLTTADVVLHLGAVSGVMPCAQDPVGTARVNVEGTRRLVEACRSAGVPVAFASSFSVVGRPERLPVDESTPTRPTHEYARQKADGERLVASLADRDGPPSAVLRMSNVYGSYWTGGRRIAKGNVLEQFVRQAPTGRLAVNAPGTQRRDFIHLEDVLDHWAAAVGWLTAPGRSGTRTFAVASGEARSVLEIAGIVEAGWHALHPDRPALAHDIVPNPRGGVELVDPEFAVDRRRTEAELGVRCRHDVADAVGSLLREAAAPPEGR